MTNAPAGIRPVPSTKTTVNIETGEAKTEAMNWGLMPPPAGKCQICAADHVPENAHNAHSLYYQYAFYGAVGRWPTWADAIAHCEPYVADQWRAALKERNAWSEPDAGVDPVAHIGDTSQTKRPKP